MGGERGHSKETRLHSPRRGSTRGCNPKEGKSSPTKQRQGPGHPGRGITKNQRHLGHKKKEKRAGDKPPRAEAQGTQGQKQQNGPDKMGAEK